MFGRKKKIEEQNALIASLQEQIATLERENGEQKRKIEEYQAMESAISRAMTDASAAADRIREDARKESDEIHETAQREYLASQKQGETLVADAHRNARDIIKAAEDKQRETHEQTDASVAAYIRLLGEFNESVKEQVKTANENAKKYAELYALLSQEMPALLKQIPSLHGTAAITAGKDAHEDELVLEAEELPLVKVSDLVEEEKGSITTDEIIEKSL